MGEEHGFFLPLVAGAQSVEHKAVLSASILDRRSGVTLSRIDAKATAMERVLYYVILIGGIEPQVVTPLIDALTEDIVNVINAAHPGAPVRLAILAAELPDR